jgi:hypothetical protein
MACGVAPGFFAFYRFVHWCLQVFAVFYRLCCQLYRYVWNVMWSDKLVHEFTSSNYTTPIGIKWLRHEEKVGGEVVGTASTVGI